MTCEAVTSYFCSGPNPARCLTRVGPSPLSGFGLFAREFIPRGTRWWHARVEDVLTISRAQYETLANSHQSPVIQGFLEAVAVYAYYAAKLEALVLCLDDSRFVNHSFTPNSGATRPDHPLCSVALRDILPGEEILEDYTTYDDAPWIPGTEFMRELTSKRAQLPLRKASTPVPVAPKVFTGVGSPVG